MGTVVVPSFKGEVNCRQIFASEKKIFKKIAK